MVQSCAQWNRTGFLKRRLNLRKWLSRWGKGNRTDFENMLWYHTRQQCLPFIPRDHSLKVFEVAWSGCPMEHLSIGPGVHRANMVSHWDPDSLSRPYSRHWRTIICYRKSPKCVLRACAGLFPGSTFWRQIMLARCIYLKVWGLALGTICTGLRRPWPCGWRNPCAFIPDPCDERWSWEGVKATEPTRGAGSAYADISWSSTPRSLEMLHVNLT